MPEAAALRVTTTTTRERKREQERARQRERAKESEKEEKGRREVNRFIHKKTHLPIARPWGGPYVSSGSSSSSSSNSSSSSSLREVGELPSYCSLEGIWGWSQDSA